MPSFKHILFPVDFSEQVSRIAPYVICMARRTGARVTMLHVMEVPTGAYPGWPAEAALINLQDIQRVRQQSLDAFLVNEFQDIGLTRLMSEGDPASGIVEYAEKENADLVMMPTHGYGPFRRFLLGSVTAKVLHDVKCPVWTSAHIPEGPAPPAGYRSVLCAVDLTPKSLPLIQWASAFARENKADLKLLHAVPPAEPRAAITLRESDSALSCSKRLAKKSPNYKAKPAQIGTRYWKPVMWPRPFAEPRSSIIPILW
jgi:nucleotide-binding universal stress UspA family protein